MNKTLTRETALDGLRGLSALMVVFSHLNLDKETLAHFAPAWVWWVLNPFTGNGIRFVAVLFVLTGYLMASLYPHVTSWSSYMQKRYTRLIPLFVCVSLFYGYFYYSILKPERIHERWFEALCVFTGTLFVGGILWRLYLRFRTAQSGRIIFWFFFITQITTAIVYVGYIMKRPAAYLYDSSTFLHLFATLVNTTLTFHFGNYIPITNGAFWSLAPEVMYYALYPLIFVVLVQHLRSRSLYRSCITLSGVFCLLLACTVAFRDLLGFRGMYPYFWMYFFLGNFLGVHKSLILGKIHAIEAKLQKPYLIPSIIFFSFALFPTFLYFVHTESQYFEYMLFYPLPFLLTAYALYEGGVIARFLKHPFLIWVGTISYSLYLTHIVVIELLRQGATINPQWSIYTLLVYCVTAVVLSLLVAKISYELLEKPYFFSKVSTQPLHQKVTNEASVHSIYRPLWLCVYILCVLAGLQREFSLTSQTIRQSAQISAIGDTISTKDTLTFSLTVQAPENNFGILTLRTRYAGSVDPAGKLPPILHTVRMTVTDLQTGSLISTNEYKGVRFDPDGKPYPFGFVRQPQSKGKSYRFDIVSINATDRDYVLFENLSSEIYGVYQPEKSQYMRRPDLLAQLLFHKILLIISTVEFWYVAMLSLAGFGILYALGTKSPPILTNQDVGR